MTVTVHFFASLKDAAQTSQISLEIAQNSEVGAVTNQICEQFPRLGAWMPYVRIAVNEEYANAQTILQNGDEIALLPPVSGGSDEPSEILARIVEREISLDEVVCAVQNQKGGGAGAICTFLGVVRENSRDLDGNSHDDIVFLDYEAYKPMAERELFKICEQVAARFDGACAILHRVGRLKVGETSVAIAVATAHRGASFEACRYAIETLKKEVPIWKKETARDGFWWSEGQNS